MNTVGCIRARLGSTPYYIAKMTAGQLIDSVGFAMEMPEWEDMSPDEKMQRTLDVNRVVNDIVPYITDDEDKFMGSLIVDIYQGFDDMTFESVEDVFPSIPGAYKGPMKDMGFLSFPGNERLIALDGQHRLLALRIAIKGLAGLPGWIAKVAPSWNNLKPHPELAKEEISVIFVEHRDTSKIRKIFNKVNRYAKLTSRSDNIITSDDDIFAVIARKLIVEGEPLAPVNDIDLVNWKNNTLSLRSKNLTTLSALYTISETLLKDDRFSSSKLPNKEKVEEAYNFVSDFWKISLDKIDAFRQYMRLTELDKPISALRENNLLLKPVTQMALAHAARMAKANNLRWEDVVEKINRIDWSFSNELWFNILIIPSANKKMITGKDAIRGAGMVISYLVMGGLMTDDEIADVRQIINNARATDDAELPPMI